MVPPFDHEWIIAGQGTVGLEILDQLPDVGTVLVPVGGGGLVSGVAAAIKLSRPDTRVVGVEPSGAASMKASIDAGTCRHPRADAQHRRWPDGGAAGRSRISRTFDAFVDDIVHGRRRGDCRRGGLAVTKAQIVAEPSGAAAVAAALAADAALRWTGRRHRQRRQPRSRGPAEVRRSKRTPAVRFTPDRKGRLAMRIETFEMERMQSTWENLVDYDMSESGIRPLTLRELTAMGFDLEAFLDEPLGYSQSNGTIELRERIAALYPGASVDQIEVTNGTSEANYLIALSQIQPGDVVAMQLPNYMQMWGVARSLGADVRHLSTAAGRRLGARLAGVRARRHATDPAPLSIESE